MNIWKICNVFFLIPRKISIIYNVQYVRFTTREVCLRIFTPLGIAFKILHLSFSNEIADTYSKSF